MSAGLSRKAGLYHEELALPTPDAEMIHMTTSPSAKLRATWLEALLPNVPFDGWTDEAAREAAKAAGLSKAEQALAAPGGIADLIETFFDHAEAGVTGHLEAAELETLGVRDKISVGLKAWLVALEPNREAVRRAAARGFLPWHASAATQRTWSLSDAIWSGIGDTSTDYNRYTKRAILAAVIPSLVMYWLDEEDPEKLDIYITRRLTRAMKIGQAGGKVFGPVLSMFTGR